jgi:hypothetical protein
MKDQLFKVQPDKNITLQLLSLFGITGFNDNHAFTRLNLIELRTVEKLNELTPILSDYYIPCKAHKYLQDVNDKKSITILRQFLKKNRYTLISKEKYIQGKKHLFYQVVPLQAPVKTPTKKDASVTITFD